MVLVKLLTPSHAPILYAIAHFGTLDTSCLASFKTPDVSDILLPVCYKPELINVREDLKRS